MIFYICADLMTKLAMAITDSKHMSIIFFEAFNTGRKNIAVLIDLARIHGNISHSCRKCIFCHCVLFNVAIIFHFFLFFHFFTFIYLKWILLLLIRCIFVYIFICLFFVRIIYIFFVIRYFSNWFIDLWQIYKSLYRLFINLLIFIYLNLIFTFRRNWLRMFWF